MEHRLTHVARPRVEVDCAPGWDQLALVHDVLDCCARQREPQHCVEAQTLPDERDDVCALLIVVGVGQWLVVWVQFADLGDGFGLDVRALREERDAPLHECGDCVEAAGQHGLSLIHI